MYGNYDSIQKHTRKHEDEIKQILIPGWVENISRRIREVHIALILKKIHNA